MDWLESAFSTAQQWLFEGAVQPLMFMLGLGNLLEDGYAATGWLLVGCIQIALMLAVIGPLQRWRPVEAVTDRAAIRTDILYTLIHRLGLFRLVLFFALDPLFDTLFGLARVEGLPVSPCIEMGWRLAPETWGQGLASEGASALVHWGFETGGYDRIVATTMAVNQASRRVMEKIGMTYARTTPTESSDPIPGREHGEVWYELTRSGWIGG